MYGDTNVAPPLKTDADRLLDAVELMRKKDAEITALNSRIRQLHREDDTAQEIRKRIYQIAARDPEPPSWVLGRGGRPGHRGVPCTIWSDWHAGEVVAPAEVAGMNEFNQKTLEKRVKKLVNTTIELSWEHMGRAPVSYPGCILMLGGDMITGDIHEELARTNDLTPQEAIENVTDLLCSAIDTMAGRFGKLFIPAVVGNHGRGTLKPRMKGRVHTSFEWNIYCNVARHFKKSPNIQFKIAEEADAYFSVYGHRYLLTHGDSLGVRGGDGIIGALGPIMRGALKTGRSEAQIGRNIDTIVMGHWHQYLPLPGCIVNNALIGYSEYARLGLRAPYSRPSQALWFTHPEHGITARWEVYLEGLRAVASEKVWVAWET